MKKIVIIKTVFLLASAFCLFSTCKKPPIEEDPQETDNTCLHIVWSKPFFDENTSTVMQDPIIADRYVIWAGYQQFSAADLTNRINAFDKTNGEKNPRQGWRGGIEDNLGYGVREFLIGGNNNDILFYSTSQSLQAFEVTSRQHLWTFAFDKSYNTFPTGRLSTLGADIIIPHFGRTFIGEVIRYNFTTGQKTTLFSFDEIINTIQWTKNEDNDTLLFFANGYKKAYCYNLTKDSIVWESTLNVEYTQTTSYHPIIVENKYVLFQCKYKVSCVDFSTGKPIWDITAISIENSLILYSDGKVIVRPHYGNVTCYDVKNGNLLWTSSDVGLSLNSSREYGKMDTYNGNLYFTTGGTRISYLCCISLATGQVKWKDSCADKGIFGGVTIDQQTGYLYCNTGWSVLCVDLNKTPKKLTIKN